MGKYDKLISGLFEDNSLQKSNYAALVKANNRVLKPLVSALLGHSNPNIRETCVEILHERNTAKAIPFLIEALRDDNIFVRQDALWAIEKISGYQAGMLQTWLNVTNTDSPHKLYKQISEWWRLNRKYIERVN